MSDNKIDENQELAEQYFEKADMAGRSELEGMSRRDKFESALSYAIRAFKLNPQEPRYVNQLLYYCQGLEKSPYDLGLAKELQIAFQVQECRETILHCFNNFIDTILEHYEENPDESKKFHFKVQLDVLERLFESDNHPATFAILSRYYEQIARHRDALELLLKSTEKYPELFGPYYIEYCYEQRRFNELIEFYEKCQIELDDKTCSYVGEAYIRSARGVGIHKKVKRIKEGPTPECHELMEKACRLLVGPFQKVLPAPDSELTSCDHNSFYAVSEYRSALINRADFIERDQNPSDDQPDPVGLRNEVVLICSKVIKFLHSLPNELQNEFGEHLLDANFDLVAACTSKRFDLKTIEKTIDIAKDLEANPKAKKHPDYGYLLNHLANLLQIYKEATGDDEIISAEEHEELHIRAISKDWRDLNYFDDYVKFLISTGKDKRAKYIKMFSYLSILLNHLIKFDQYKINPPKLPFGFPDDDLDIEDHGQYFEDMPESVQNALVPLFEYFQPLRDALEVYRQKYELYLEGVLLDTGIAPKGHDKFDQWFEERVQSRVKKPWSILLKMLKRDKHRFHEMDDWIGFQVFPDTIEQSKELYSRVKEDFYKFIRERYSLDDNPSETVFRSAQVIGIPREDDEVPVEFQTRPKYVEDEIQSGYAHHNVMKVKTGTELAEKVDQNPWLYLKQLHGIMGDLIEVYKELGKSGAKLNPDSVIKTYYKKM